LLLKFLQGEIKFTVCLSTKDKTASFLILFRTFIVARTVTNLPLLKQCPHCYIVVPLIQNMKPAQSILAHSLYTGAYCLLGVICRYFEVPVFYEHNYYFLRRYPKWPHWVYLSPSVALELTENTQKCTVAMTHYMKRMLLTPLLLHTENQATRVWMGILRYSKFCNIHKGRIKFILFSAFFVHTD